MQTFIQVWLFFGCLFKLLTGPAHFSKGLSNSLLPKLFCRLVCDAVWWSPSLWGLGCWDHLFRQVSVYACWSCWGVVAVLCGLGLQAPGDLSGLWNDTSSGLQAVLVGLECPDQACASLTTELPPGLQCRGRRTYCCWLSPIPPFPTAKPYWVTPSLSIIVHQHPMLHMLYC